MSDHETLDECVRVADAHGCVVVVTTRDDDPGQPEAVGVWVGPGGAGGLDLVGSGETVSEAAWDALETIRGWE